MNASKSFNDASLGKPESLYILLVEDSKVDAYLVSQSLQKHMGCVCVVKHFENMAAAENYLNSDNKVDVIVLDLGLPDTVNAEESFSRIEALKEQIPIVVLTSEEDHGLALRLVDRGAEDYMMKSVIKDNPRLLCDNLKFALSRHKNLTDFKKAKDNEIKEKDMALHWMSGGYSM